MANNYCYIENGVVVDGPRPLYKSWRNVSGLHLMPDEKLKELGWLPWEEVHIDYDYKLSYRDGYIIDIQADKVIYTNVIKDYTAQQLKQNTMNDWGSTLDQMDSWQFGITRSTEDLMRIIQAFFPTEFKAMEDHITNNQDSEFKYFMDKYKNKREFRDNKPPQP